MADLQPAFAEAAAEVCQGDLGLLTQDTSERGCLMGALAGLKNSGHTVKNERLFHQLRSC